jgi:hypothetical protein
MYEYQRDDVYARFWRDEAIRSASVQAFTCSLRRRIESLSQEVCGVLRFEPLHRPMQLLIQKDPVTSQKWLSFLSILTLLSVASKFFSGKAEKASIKNEARRSAARNKRIRDCVIKFTGTVGGHSFASLEQFGSCYVQALLVAAVRRKWVTTIAPFWVTKV